MWAEAARQQRLAQQQQASLFLSFSSRWVEQLPGSPVFMFLFRCPIHFPFGVSYSIGPGLIDWACNSIILSFWRTDNTVYAVALGWYGGWFMTHDCLLTDSDCSICYLPSSYLLIPLLWNNFFFLRKGLEAHVFIPKLHWTPWRRIKLQLTPHNTISRQKDLQRRP